MYLCKHNMASTLQKLLIPIFGYYNVSIPLLKHFIKETPHKYKHLATRLNQYSLMFHTLLIQRLRLFLITLQGTLTFTCGMKFYYFNNHFSTIMQGCYNSARLPTLHKLPQPCDNLVIALQSCSKVATTQLFPYGKLYQSTLVLSINIFYCG